MKFFAYLRSLASSLFHRSRAEVEMDEELRLHIQNRADDLERSGLSRAEAERRARIEFGGREKFKEECRDALGTHFLDTLLQDFRFGLRTLRRSPGFTVVAVLTLALGIGANTAIFSLLDGLVLRELPVPHPEQLVRFGAHAPDDSYSAVSFPMLQKIATEQKVFSSVFAWWGDGIWNVETNGQLSRADIWAVTGNFHVELGAVPEIGRLLEPADVDLNSSSAAQVAVLGYGFWQRNYGGSKDVIGKTLKIEGVPFTIIGVARRGFNGMAANTEAEVTVPLTAEPLIASGDADVQKHLQRPDALWISGGARLASGVTLEQARAQLDSLWPAIRAACIPPQATAVSREHFLKLQMGVESGATGSSFIRGRFAKPIYILLGISGIVLLLACVNLASLMLSRAAARSHEFGVRVALGAGRRSLTQQILVESVTLSVAGTLVGFAFASWGSHALAALILGESLNAPSSLNLSPDLRILAFTAAVSVLTGVLFGLAPAWRATRGDPSSALQQGSRTLGRGTGSFGDGLIITQIALSFVLVAGAGLFLRTLEKLRDTRPGFETRGIFEVQLFVKPNAFKNADRTSYFRELTEQVSNLPGVTSAGMEHMAIGGSAEWKARIRLHNANAEDYSGDCEMVMPGFFRTEGIALLQGRGFEWNDNGNEARVAIVSQNFAEKAFPNGNAIGQNVDIGSDSNWQNLRIVGIVSNASLYDIRKKAPPTVYLPTLQYGNWADDDELLVRTNNSFAVIAPSVRGVIDALGRHAVMSVKPLKEIIDRSILQERLTAMLSAFFGALALLIAAIGLYGLMAHNVTRRTREAVTFVMSLDVIHHDRRVTELRATQHDL